MRLAGHESTNPLTGVTETALPYGQQRAIALDYEANIAMTVRMLGQKWNQLAAAGMLINDGDPTKIENWYFATWAYNTGFYPDSGGANPWGVGWTNNPVSNLYPAGRHPFLTLPSDAAHPSGLAVPREGYRVGGSRYLARRNPVRGCGLAYVRFALCLVLSNRMVVLERRQGRGHAAPVLVL